MLGTNRHLMDEVTGQFYAVYHNGYKQMLTHPRLHQLWDQGELLEELAATRHHFGYEKGTPVPTALASQPSSYTNADAIPDLTMEKPPPHYVPFQRPPFNLDRPIRCLTMDERIEVHHNYVSAISKLEHKKDPINMLKSS